MNKKYLRFEQLEVFRPMPVTDALKRQIRSESEKAKALAQEVLNRRSAGQIADRLASAVMRRQEL
jgi:hypothetical protein